MRLAGPERKNPDQQWHTVKPAQDKDKEDFRRNDKYHDKGGFHGKPGGFHKKDYNQNKPHFDRRKEEEQEPDLDNKFFKGKTEGEFNIKFTRNTSKQSEGAQNKTEDKGAKSNPFGGAVARDETKFIEKFEKQHSKPEEKKPEEEKSTTTETTEKKQEEVADDKTKESRPPGISNKPHKKEGGEHKGERKFDGGHRGGRGGFHNKNKGGDRSYNNNNNKGYGKNQGYSNKLQQEKDAEEAEKVKEAKKSAQKNQFNVFNALDDESDN